jgi:hypothetical protein
LLVHIGGPSSNQATTLETQVIHMIQELFGQTLRRWVGHSALGFWATPSALFLITPAKMRRFVQHSANRIYLDSGFLRRFRVQIAPLRVQNLSAHLAFSTVFGYKSFTMQRRFLIAPASPDNITKNSPPCHAPA